MPVLSDADRSVADTIALTLMRRAFLALAEAHIAFDPERGRGHLHELQKDAAATIREFFEQEPDEADARIFFDVALKLRGTLREALGLPDESDALAQAA